MGIVWPASLERDATVERFSDRLDQAVRAKRSAVLVGIAFYHPDWSLKLLIIAYFVLMTNPISSHALARAANAILHPAQSPAADASRADRKRSEA